MQRALFQKNIIPIEGKTNVLSVLINYLYKVMSLLLGPLIKTNFLNSLDNIGIF